MAYYFLISILAVLTSPLHEFPLGHIDRSVNAVVRDQQLTVEYAIGLSDETALHLLKAAELKSSILTAVESATVLGESGLPKEDDPSPRELNPESATGGSAQLTQQPETELVNEGKVIQALKEAAERGEFGRLELVCNDQPVALNFLDASASPRHHVTLLVRFQAELPDAKKIALKLVDRNFRSEKVSKGSVGGTKAAALPKLATTPKGASPGLSGEENESKSLEKTTSSLGRAAKEQVDVDKNPEKSDFVITGGVRLAIKAKGRAILLDSNAVPVLVRAKSVDLNGLDSVAIDEACTIVARIGLAPDKE